VGTVAGSAEQVADLVVIVVVAVAVGQITEGLRACL